MKVVKESPLCREGSDGDNTLQQLPEIGKDGRACVGLHSSQVTAGIQVADCQLAICKADEEGWDQKVRKYNAGNNVSAKILLVREDLRDGEDGSEETGKGGVHGLK